MSKNSKPYNRNRASAPSSKGGDSIANSSRKTVSDAIQAKPIEVQVNGNFDRAFRTFRSMVQKERILSLYKEKQTFEKRSDKLRRKRNEARRKLYELEQRRSRPLEDRKPRKREEDSE